MFSFCILLPINTYIHFINFLKDLLTVIAYCFRPYQKCLYTYTSKHTYNENIHQQTYTVNTQTTSTKSVISLHANYACTVNCYFVKLKVPKSYHTLYLRFTVHLRFRYKNINNLQLPSNLILKKCLK